MEARGDYVFQIRTVKASPFRTLVDAVKDILTEVNMEIDSAGIKIMAMDGTHTILVHMRLYADRFDEFFCAQKCILGIDFVNFNKMVSNNILNFNSFFDPDVISYVNTNITKAADIVTAPNKAIFTGASILLAPSILPPTTINNFNF